MKIPRLMISGVSSGSGKTTALCAIIKALKNRGLNVAACKVGPDYIDTMFHEKIMDVKSKNLDLFLCGEANMKYLFLKHGKTADITITEGVMGYYDGIGMAETSGSSFDTALKLKMPVIIVVNAKSMAITTAALIKGMTEFRKNNGIKGVILNNISRGIYERLKDVIEKETGIETVGFIPPNDDFKIESRHLGLVTPDKIADISEKIEKLGRCAEECIDINRIIEIAENTEDLEEEKTINIKKGEKVKIGVARDKAFCFYYRDNIELLEEMGAEIVYFSPLYDKTLPNDIDGIIINGGYPELYCRELGENIAMRKSIKEKIETGTVCIAECGGFMYLQKSIEAADGKKYNMVGILDGESKKREKLVRFGYINLTAKKDCFLLKKGEEVRGHEFHYWDSSDNGSLFKAVKPTGIKEWECIREYKNLICGFPHIYFYSNINFAENFLNKCRKRKEERKC